MPGTPDFPNRVLYHGDSPDFRHWLGVHLLEMQRILRADSGTDACENLTLLCLHATRKSATG